MTEEMEQRQKLHRLVDEKDELEVRYHQVVQEQEEEEDRLHYHLMKLENEWMDCGQYDPELGRILEEERELLDRFKRQKYDIEEEVRNAYQKDRIRMEDEMDGLQRQLRNMEE